MAHVRTGPGRSRGLGGRASRQAGRRSRAAGLVVGAVSTLVVTAAPAHAQPFGPGACGGGCYYADNSTETYFYDGLTVASIAAMEDARTRRLEPTDMTTTLQTSSNTDTDIEVFDENYPASTWAGTWGCALMVSGSTTKCNSGQITFNLRYAPVRYSLACQEQGHAVGLDHSTSTGSCMYQNAAVAAGDYDAHDKGHINGYY